MVTFSRVVIYGVSDKDYIESINSIPSNQPAVKIVLAKIRKDLAYLEARLEELIIYYREGGEENKPKYLYTEEQTHISMDTIEQLMSVVRQKMSIKLNQRIRYTNYIRLTP